MNAGWMDGVVMQAAGASIQIAGDTLTNSSERLVVVTGSVDAVVRAIFHISDIMIQVLVHRIYIARILVTVSSELEEASTSANQPLSLLAVVLNK